MKKENSIAGLNREIERLRNLLEETNKLAEQFEDVKKAKEAFERSKSETDRLLNIFAKLKDEKRDELNKPIEEKFNLVEKQIIELEKSKKEKNKIETPKHISDLINAFRFGVDYGSKPFIVSWVSPSKRFFIMTNPGHTSYISRMSGSKYFQSQHFLMDCTFPSQTIRKINVKWDGKDSFNNLDKEHGYELFNSAKHKDCRCEGRLGKDTIEKWIEIANKEEGEK